MTLNQFRSNGDSLHNPLSRGRVDDQRIFDTFVLKVDVRPVNPAGGDVFRVLFAQ